MTAKTYIARTYPFKVVGVLLMVLGSLVFLFGGHISWVKLPVAILGICLAYIGWKVPSPKIEIDENGIKRLQHGKSNSSLFSRLVIPDTECKWSQIDSVSTTRLNSGTFLTALYLTEDLPNKPKYRVTIESSLFTDYVAILRIVKERATQAHFDKTSELILNGQIDIRSVRPLYWVLFLFIVVSAFLFILLTRKG